MEERNDSLYQVLYKNGKEVKADIWTGKDGLFMRALRNAYNNVSNTKQIDYMSMKNPLKGKIGDKEWESMKTNKERENAIKCNTKQQ